MYLIPTRMAKIKKTVTSVVRVHTHGSPHTTLVVVANKAEVLEDSLASSQKLN